MTIPPADRDAGSLLSRLLKVHESLCADKVRLEYESITEMPIKTHVELTEEYKKLRAEALRRMVTAT